MPSLSLSRSARGAGTFERTAETIAPATLSRLRIQIVMDVAALTDPGSDVEARIEWAPDFVNFTRSAGVRLIGKAGNTTASPPYIEFEQDIILRLGLRGKPVRGFLRAIRGSVGTVGVTLEWDE